MSQSISYRTLIVLGLIICHTAAANTEFAVGQYSEDDSSEYRNNLRRSAVLSIPDAHGLIVSIEGETENCCETEKVTTACCDFLTVTDSKGRLVGRYSGEISEKLAVLGSSIHVTFRSDAQTTNQGVIVTIEEREMDAFFYELRERLAKQINRTLTAEATGVNEQIVNQLRTLKTLQAHLATVPIPSDALSQFATTASEIATVYQDILTKGKHLNKLQQSVFSVLQQVGKSTRENRAVLTQRQQRYSRRIALYQRSDSTKTISSLERQKREATEAGDRAILDALTKQQIVWVQFLDKQKALAKVLREYKQQFNLLLHIISVHAKVYRQMATLAALQQSQALVTTSLDFSPLQTVVAEIARCETEIRELLNSIPHSEQYSVQDNSEDEEFDENE